MSNDPKADALLQQIQSFITTASAHTGTGEELDLAGLDGTVQELCEHVLDLPKPEADAYREALAGLAGELNTLKARMEQAQAELREQLAALNARQKAAKAYTTGKAAAPKNPKDSE